MARLIKCLLIPATLGVLLGSYAWLQWVISGEGQDSKACAFIQSVDKDVEEKILGLAKAEAEKWSEADQIETVLMPRVGTDGLIPNVDVGMVWLYLEGRDVSRVEFSLGRSRILVFSPKRKFGYTDKEICRKDNWVLFGFPRTDD